MRRLFFILILAALLWEFPGIGKTIDDLRRTSVRFVKAVASGEAGKYFQSRAGEEELDPNALGAIYLLRASGFTEYQASEKVRHIYWYQRIVEGAWPIRVVEAASPRVLLTSESLPNNCKKQGEQNGMVLAVCH